MRKNGYSIIEALIAIAILLVGIIGSFILVIRSLNMSSLIIDNLTASFLAQQGIETIINQRDNNWINNQNWLNGISSSTPQRVPGFQKFTRTIIITPITSDIIKADCKIDWTTKQYSITATDYLYNWAKGYL